MLESGELDAPEPGEVSTGRYGLPFSKVIVSKGLLHVHPVQWVVAQCFGHVAGKQLNL